MICKIIKGLIDSLLLNVSVVWSTKFHITQTRCNTQCEYLTPFVSDTFYQYTLKIYWNKTQLQLLIGSRLRAPWQYVPYKNQHLDQHITCKTDKHNDALQNVGCVSIFPTKSHFIWCHPKTFKAMTCYATVLELSCILPKGFCLMPIRLIVLGISFCAMCFRFPIGHFDVALLNEARSTLIATWFLLTCLLTCFQFI